MTQSRLSTPHASPLEAWSSYSDYVNPEWARRLGPPAINADALHSSTVVWPDALDLGHRAICALQEGIADPIE